MSSPLKRIRTDQPEEPAAIPASVTSVLKQVLDRDDVTNVDFRDYALIVQGNFGTGTTVYDFGGQMWLVPASLLADKSPDDQVYCLLDPNVNNMPPKLLTELTGDLYRLDGTDGVGSMLTWAARTQVGNIVVVGDQ